MKRYALIKNKGAWTESERNRFEIAFKIYGKNWKRLTAAVGTRTMTQVRSHGQKFIPRIQNKERLPPVVNRQIPQTNSNNSNNPQEELAKKMIYHAAASAYILSYSLIQRSLAQKSFDGNGNDQQDSKIESK